MSELNFGAPLNQSTINADLLTGPTNDLVQKLLLQLTSIKGFVEIFGDYTQGKDQQRYASYNRMDWSIRQLPVMNVYESGNEAKSSDQGFLTGTITMAVYWPPKFRRSDLARVQATFKGALQNFFASHWTKDMLDEIYWHVRPMKVDGLNELGKTLNWLPQTEGIVESELVPVNILDVNYRIDLRAWYRAIEFQGRTKADPFDYTLAALTSISGDINGVTDQQGQDVAEVVPVSMTVQSP